MIKKRSGFTLIELMIALCIIVVVLGIVNSMFITGNRIFNDSDVKSTLQMEAKDIQEAVSNIGMQASEIIDIQYFKGKKNVNKIFLRSFKDDTEKVFLIEHKDEGQNKFQISTISFGENEEKLITRQDLEKHNGKYMYDRNDVRVYSENIEKIEILSVNGKELKDEKDNTITKISRDELNGINSMKIKIALKQKKGFANVTYPVEFTVTLRN